MNKIRPSHIIDFIDNMGEEGMRQDEHKEKKHCPLTLSYATFV
jgi:hypothetical protein